MKAIDIHNLTKTYADGTVALQSINMQVEEGDFFALLGANGAGKTTVISILTSLVNKSSGQVSVFGYSLDDDPNEVKRCIGVVPQEFNFNLFEKVQDIVTTQAGYFGVPYHKAMEDSEEVLKRVGLWDKRRVVSRALSGGMKRRLMIARALIHKPKLLILDEPTAGVDVELRYGMWEYLKEINKNGTTILLTTHYLEEVEQMCQHAAMIKDGKIIANDQVKNLMRTLNEETYLLTVDSMCALDAIEEFLPKLIDEHTLEITIDERFGFNEMIQRIAKTGIHITDIRPKGNRLEKLFLKILK